MKSRRQDADYRIDEIVQGERLTEHAFLSAEVTFEKPIAYHDDAAPARIAFRKRESGPELWFHAEHFKEVGRGACTLDSFGLRTTRQIKIGIFKTADRFELRHLFRPFPEVAWCDGNAFADSLAKGGIFFPKHDESLRNAKRKRA